MRPYASTLLHLNWDLTQDECRVHRKGNVEAPSWTPFRVLIKKMERIAVVVPNEQQHESNKE